MYTKVGFLHTTVICLVWSVKLLIALKAWAMNRGKRTKWSTDRMFHFYFDVWFRVRVRCGVGDGVGDRFRGRVKDNMY